MFPTPIKGMSVNIIRSSDGKLVLEHTGITREGPQKFMTIHDDYAAVSKKLEAILTTADVLLVS